MTAVQDAGVARAWRGAATWYVYLLLAGNTYLISSQGNILPFLKAELNLSYGEVSLHTSAVAVGMLIVGLIGDRFIGRFGRRAMLATGGLGASVAMVLLTLAPNVVTSIASCLLYGLTGSFISAVVSALLTDMHGPRRNVAIAEANALCYAFAIMAPVIAGIAAWAGWSWRLVPLAGALACTTIVLVWRRTPILAGRPAGARTTMVPLSAAFWGYWAMLSFSVAIEFSVLLWAPAYLQQVVGLAPSSAAIGAAAFFAAMLVGRMVGIKLVAIFPVRRIFLSAAATTLAGFVAYWGSGMPAIAIAGLFVIGLGVSVLFPLTIGLAMGAAGGASVRAGARAMMAPGLAILVDPPLLGGIADHAGLWIAQLMVPVFMILAVIAFYVAEALGRRRPAVG